MMTQSEYSRRDLFLGFSLLGEDSEGSACRQRARTGTRKRVVQDLFAGHISSYEHPGVAGQGWESSPPGNRCGKAHDGATGNARQLPIVGYSKSRSAGSRNP